MKIRGTAYICDFCGKNEFISDENKCETLDLLTKTGWKSINGMDACPDCANEYDLMFERFIYGKKERRK